jgi:hypothetical protein
MRKLISLLAVILCASIAWAAPDLLGTKKLPGEDLVYDTLWAHPKSDPSGIINSTGATKSYPTGSMCDTGSVIFETVSGADIKNVALQVTYDTYPGYTTTSVFYNAAGKTEATPWHSIINGNTDSYKFDFNSRGFNRWRLNCLVGCDVTNTISQVSGICWRKGK